MPHEAFHEPFEYKLNMDDIVLLLETADRIIAEDIQRLLEESDIYVLLESDHAASSIVNIYSGMNPAENIRVKINKTDYQKGVEILKDSPYHDMLKQE